MGEKAEEPEGHAEPGTELGSAAAVAVALSAAAKDNDPIAADARAFLREHTRMVRVQLEHLHEQRILQLSHLRWRRFEDQMTAALRIMVTVVLGIVFAGFLALVWAAHEDHGLVVEAFSVPPDLTARGLTGQVMAQRLLDKLTAMQAATDSARPANSYTNNWGDDLKVEIPTTGVSFEQLQRFLVAWLGDETHINGEVVRTPAGLSVTARAGDTAAQTFDGTEADLDALTQKSAEAIYEATQPYRYAVFLGFAGSAPGNANEQKTFTILRRLTNSPDRTERGWALGGLSLSQTTVGDFAGGLASARAADETEPTLMGASDAGAIEGLLGHDEAALIWNERTARQNWHADPTDAAVTKAYDIAMVASMRADFGDAAQKFAAVETMKNYSGYPVIAAAQHAQALALAHDASSAAEVLAARGWVDDTAVAPIAAYSFATCLPKFEVAAAKGDWAGAVADLIPLPESSAGKTPVGHQTWLTYGLPKLAYATAMSGDTAHAEELIATTPADCYLCVRTRAKIAAAKQDWTGAEHWFAEAVRQAPSLPFAYFEWGAMLLAKGDTDAAIAKFTLGTQKGPHFADPLEAWGEALIAQKQFDQAATKFAAAEKFAPRWGRLHLKWGEALELNGKKDEAEKQYTIAEALDLSEADKAQLDHQSAR